MNDDYLGNLSSGIIENSYLNSNNGILRAADVVLNGYSPNDNCIRVSQTLPDYTVTAVSSNIDSPYYYNYNYAPPVNTVKESILEDIITFCSGFCPLGQEKICDETTKKTCPLGKRIRLEGRG